MMVMGLWTNLFAPIARWFVKSGWPPV